MSPLHDDYQSEKTLKDIAMNLAPALTTILDEVEPQRFGFILFVVDMREGLMQYISDTDPNQSLKSIQDWCVRREIDLEDAERSNQDSK